MLGYVKWGSEYTDSIAHEFKYETLKDLEESWVCLTPSDRWGVSHGTGLESLRAQDSDSAFFALSHNLTLEATGAQKHYMKKESGGVGGGTHTRTHVHTHARTQPWVWLRKKKNQEKETIPSKLE